MYKFPLEFVAFQAITFTFSVKFIRHIPLEYQPILISGAVTGLKNVLHPIAVARLVMEHTPHVLLSGEGVQEFAKQHNVPLEESLHTKVAWDALEEFKKSETAPTKMEIGYDILD